MQLVHQDPYASLNPVRTIGDTLRAPLLHHKLVRGRSEATQRAAELLTQVDLTPPQNFLTKYPHQLSGGQRQRVAVARALALNPRLIIADEAVSMVDVSIRVSILNTMLKLRNELGVAFLFITHDLAVVKYFGWEGYVGVMYVGKLVEYGRTPQIIGRPLHPVREGAGGGDPGSRSRSDAQQEQTATAQPRHSESGGVAERLRLSPSLSLLRGRSLRRDRAAVDRRRRRPRSGLPRRRPGARQRRRSVTVRKEGCSEMGY